MAILRCFLGNLKFKFKGCGNLEAKKFLINAYLITSEDLEEIFLLDRLSPGARNKVHSADKEVDVLLEMVIGDCVIEKFREVPRYGPRYVGEAIVCLRLISSPDKWSE